MTKRQLINRAERNKNKDGGGKVKKPQSSLWSCTADPRVCKQPKHHRIGCAVHGSKEDAERCIKLSMSLDGTM